MGKLIAGFGNGAGAGGYYLDMLDKLITKREFANERADIRSGQWKEAY